ncbi:MAG TPA: hypothetical protein VJ729_01885 [Nitrososphaeraceae archaeon]|nr:hypothetical protein [Nitrososphaeraceae archaeon]
MRTNKYYSLIGTIQGLSKSTDQQQVNAIASSLFSSGILKVSTTKE